MFLVSVIYFRNSKPNANTVVGVLTSCHGALLAIIYSGATFVGITNNQHEILGLLVMVLNLVVFSLIVFSMLFYQGPKTIHFLQLVLIPMLLVFGMFSVILAWTDSF